MISQKQNGFTLIETLIATMIMMGTIVIVANTWSGNVSRVHKMRIQQRAALLLERLVAETRIKYKDDLTQVPEEDQGEFEGVQNYIWEIKTQPAEMGTVIELAASGILNEQQENNESQNSDFTRILTNILKEYLNKPDLIKEIEYAVIYQKDKKKVRYTASSYIVNFNAGMPSLPGLGNLNSQTNPENEGSP